MTQSTQTLAMRARFSRAINHHHYHHRSHANGRRHAPTAKFKFSLMLSLLCLLYAFNGNAQAQSTVAGFNPGTNGTVFNVAVQPDGKILIGGSFTMIGGGGTGSTSRSNIARLNADGSVDTAFNPGADNFVYSLAVQPDGKILVGGGFATIGGGGSGSTARSRIARLNADGSVDSSFDPGANGAIESIAPQADGRILIGGNFSTVGGGGTGSTTRFNLAQLNADGSLVSSFDPGADSPVGVIVEQPDGKVLIGGNFTTVGGGGFGSTLRRSIARLNADGSVDTAFDPGANGTPYSIALQPDGKILVGGNFTTVGGGGSGSTARSRIARLNADGSVDTAFDPGTDGVVYSVALQANGKILVGGDFTTVGGGGSGSTARSRIARLNADGSVDTSFGQLNLDNGIFSLAPQADGKILIGGNFTSFDGGTPSAIVRQHLALLTNPEAATQIVSVSIDGTTITWERTGATPEVARITFELSIDAGVTFAPLIGTPVRISNGWQLTGQNISVNQAYLIRARGYYSGGIFSASNSIVESTLIHSVTADITGFVYTDANNNGVKDAGESGLQNVAISLSGMDDLGATVNLSATTDVNGLYTFTSVRQSDSAGYTLTETQPVGYFDGLDAKQGVVIAGSNTTNSITSLVLVGGTNSANNNFGELAPASVTGFVYVDVNNNGVKDAGESGLTGVTLQLTGANDLGPIAPMTVMTSTGGGYTFTALRPSDTTGYTITETQPVGYFDGLDAKAGIVIAGSNMSDAITGLSVVSGSANIDNDFGEIAPTISITPATLPDGSYKTAYNQTLTAAGGNAPYTFAVTTGALPAGLTLSGAGVISGTPTVAPGVFNFTVTATDNFNFTKAQTYTLTIVKAAQTITFMPPDRIYGEAPFALAASASSDLSVTFTLVSGPATLSGNTVTLNGIGSVTVRASQAGNDNYLAATDVERSFNVASPGGGIFEFGAASYEAGESAGAVTITVKRTGDTSGASSVDFQTTDAGDQTIIGNCAAVNGNASAKCDYTLALGTLRFAAGQATQTFVALLTPDAYVEGAETTTLVLSNPSSSAALGAQATAVLRINDTTENMSVNPVDVSNDFVRQQYHDFLGREPDAPGLGFWTNNIEKCKNDASRPAGQTIAQCVDIQRQTTSAAFFISNEFQVTGNFIYRLYKGALVAATPNYDTTSGAGRYPRYEEFVRDLRQLTAGIVVNDKLASAQIEANRVSFAEQFVARAEFKAIYDALSNEQYVDKLFATTGVAASATDRAALVAGLNDSMETRATVLRKITDGTTVNSDGALEFTTAYGKAFYDREFNRSFVLMQYFGYLQRDPDQGGYTFWLTKLNYYGDFLSAEMVRSFLLSPEYRRRFGAQ